MNDLKSMNKPNSNSSTGVKYLHIDYYKKHGHKYIVRVTISGKHFVVWTGNEFEIGEKVAEKVQILISKSINEFIDWYDNEREDWLKENGY